MRKSPFSVFCGIYISMKVFRILTAVFISFTVVFTAVFGRYKTGEAKSEEIPAEYKGIITLWQIDSFEGGVGSRKQFLLRVARGFEKENEGVLVMVTEQTTESVKDNFSKGIYPDMISFGPGAEVKEVSELSVEKVFRGGKVGEKAFATAWCRGGYVLIANPKLVFTIGNSFDELVVSQGEYTQPLLALYLEGMRSDNIEVLKPMEAYVKFTSGKVPYFLGTQRDVNRLLNRGAEMVCKPLSAYNDLYQYVSITATEQIKRFYAEKFIEYLVSDTVQKDLRRIGMLSAFAAVECDNEYLAEMQSVKNLYTVSAFSSSVDLKNLQELSLSALQGNDASENKIKNMLV